MAGAPGEGSIERLAAYHAIDTEVLVGRVPLTTCLELQEVAAGQVLGPGALLDQAWLGLETSMAMVRGRDPQTGSPFTLKEISEAKNQAAGGFRALMRDDQLLPGQRASAGLALASVDTHHEMARNPRSPIIGESHVRYLRGIQAAARRLLEEQNRPSEDDDLLRTMTAIALFAEYAQELAWALPASPRQPWSINTFQRHSNKMARLVIADEAPDGIVPVPVSALGDDLWNEGEAAPHATLTRYLKMPPGFAQYDRTPIAAKAKKSSQRGRTDILNFSIIPDRIYDALNSYQGSAQTVSEPGEAPVSVQAEAPPARPARMEIAWYQAQPSTDFRDVHPARLQLNMHVLEEARAQGSLDIVEEYNLGWMQLEDARGIAAEAQQKRLEAQQARTQADRVSKFDARALLAEAAAADQAAEQLLETSRQRFDVAQATWLSAADAAPKDKIGDALFLRLSAEAAPVYKALFTEAEPAMLSELVNNYVRRLAMLYLPMREAEKQLRRSDEQLDALYEAALITAACLLVTGSSDETARDLALPASPRAGGSQGEMEVIVFPIDYLNNSYDMTVPVNMQLRPGKDVVVGRRHVLIGLDVITKKGDMLGLLGRLIAPAAGNSNQSRGKGKSKKRRDRAEPIDAIAYRIADAIADASNK